MAATPPLPPARAGLLTSPRTPKRLRLLVAVQREVQPLVQAQVRGKIGRRGVVRGARRLRRRLQRRRGIFALGEQPGETRGTVGGDPGPGAAGSSVPLAELRAPRPEFFISPRAAARCAANTPCTVSFWNVASASLNAGSLVLAYAESDASASTFPSSSLADMDTMLRRSVRSSVAGALTSMNAWTTTRRW